MALALVSLIFIAIFALAYTYGSNPRPEMPDQRAVALATPEPQTVDSLAGNNGSGISNARTSSSITAGAAVFTICHRGGGTNCVVDGDTAWIGGEKIRIADIDAPETHPPRCDHEAKLGDRATLRLAELMNAGPFELKMLDRDVDRYGRKLRVLVRDGRSIGDQLVAEGLARTWEGRRRPWC
jgi:endonuclease YncB( thermonuclease family)